jgi:hypothetical protein
VQARSEERDLATQCDERRGDQIESQPDQRPANADDAQRGIFPRQHVVALRFSLLLPVEKPMPPRAIYHSDLIGQVVPIGEIREEPALSQGHNIPVVSSLPHQCPNSSCTL